MVTRYLGQKSNFEFIKQPWQKTRPVVVKEKWLFQKGQIIELH